MNEEKLKELLSQGKSVAQCAIELQCTKNLLYHYIRRNNIVYNKRKYPETEFNLEKVLRIKEQIRNGTYVIDAERIADAILGILNHV